MKLRTKYAERLPTACGLVLDVSLFEGSGKIAHDLSGKGNEGVITDATWGSDKNGVCLDLNGSTSYIECEPDSSLNFGAGNFSTSCMIKPRSFSQWAELLRKYDGSNVGWYMSLNDVEPYNKIYVKYGEGVERIVRSTSLLSADEWVHVTFVHEAIGYDYVYINGKEDTKQSSYNDNTNALDTLLLGGVWSYFFDGLMIHVRLYNRALSAKEIKHIYEQPDHDYCRGN